ncbi:hypothetical protein Tco_0153104 [Tanacetum coccineum]
MFGGRCFRLDVLEVLALALALTLALALVSEVDIYSCSFSIGIGIGIDIGIGIGIGIGIVIGIGFVMCSISASTTCFGSARFSLFCIWFRTCPSDCAMHLPSRSSLYLCDFVPCICLNLHLFGLHRNETPFNTESALWDAPKLRVCFSVLVYFVFDKLSMFTAAAL